MTTCQLQPLLNAGVGFRNLTLEQSAGVAIYQLSELLGHPSVQSLVTVSVGYGNLTLENILGVEAQLLCNLTGGNP
jgi:hypothetical protein